MPSVRARITVPLLALGGAIGACHASSSSGTAPHDAAAPAVDSGAPYVPTFHPLDSDGHVMRDQQGRTVILRGYNVKVNGLFDVTPDDGRPPNEVIPPTDANDFAMMQKAGVNVLRLPVNWSAFEPQQGNYVASYLAAIDAFLDTVRPFGFYVLLDFHEDGWSKDICEDGAPAWATVVDPDDVEGGSPNGDCHACTAALSAHSNFFDYDADQLQEAFIAMYTQFAQHFVNEELVFGYEIFNEPISSDPNVDAFSIKAATAIRKVDPGHLILWEPSALRNQLNEALESPTPFPVPGGVYAVHIYTTSVLFPNSIYLASQEAQAWGEPLFVTEHGANPLEDGGIAWVDQQLDGFDQYLASSMDWIWNPGVVTCDAGGGPRDLVAGGLVLQHLTRPYAMAVGGDLTSTTWDGASLTIAFSGHPGVPATHDVFWNVGTPSVTCDGKALEGVTVDPQKLVATVTCGGAGSHTLVFSN